MVIRRHLVPHLGRVRLRELTPEHVEALLVRLEGPGFNSTSKVPGRVVMEVLGHSSYQLTMNTYSHVAPELNHEAAQLMAGALWDNEGPPSSGAIRRQLP